MTNRVAGAGTVLYEAARDTVKTLDIVAKGTVRASRDYCIVDLPAGSIIGIGEEPGGIYNLTYEAMDEVSLYSYNYESEASLVALFKANPKLLGMLVAGAIRFARNLQTATLDTMDQARAEYAHVTSAAEEYKTLAVSVGTTPKDYPELDLIDPPSMLDPARGWHRDFVEDLFTYESRLKKDIFTIPSIGLGLGLTVNSYALETKAFVSMIFDYLEALRGHSREFMAEYQTLKNKAASSAEGINRGDFHDDPSIHACMDAIMNYAAPEPSVFDGFAAMLNRFKRIKDRYSSDDEMRKLRRELSANFYEIYTAVFMEAVKDDWAEIPVGVKMFLLFGYVDEELAGADNAAKLAAIADSLKLGADERVLTIFEWLKLIYQGRVMPSKNEFDLDYPSYLKSLKRNGDISEEDEQRLLDSEEDRLYFEVKNLFANGNRLTYGQITTFVPVFDSEHVTRRIEQAYLDADVVNRQIEAIKSVDYRAFCRQGVFSRPEAGINAYYTDDEVLPYVILMPNMGSRASLWQEIEAKKRGTPARMIISIFHTETIEDTFIRLVGDFRWEMCKTEQGVHWNDISDPSLTAMYCDYLQFYRKNSALSAETKEKIQIALKNNSNNFKKVFAADYYTYIKYESTGALRLNREARGILFDFCPFSAEIRARIGDNPQFAQLIKKHEAEAQNKQRALQNIIAKLEKSGIPVPGKLNEQMAFFGK